MTKWALIGASTIARQFMVDAILHSGGVIKSVMSADLARAKQFADTIAAHTIAADTAIITPTADLTDIISDETIDAVYISTVNDLHFDQAMAAIHAGKHVLCEKPLATRLLDAKTMVTCAKQAGIVFATNHHLRNGAGHQLLRQMIGEGEIGEVLSARVFHAVHLPSPLQGWRLHNAKAGGGVILDITVHDVDILRFVLNDDPLEVSALTRNSGMAADDLEDEVMGVMRFKRGTLVQFHDAFTTRYAGTGFEIHGTQGSLLGHNIMQQNQQMGTIVLRNAQGERAIEYEKNNLYRTALHAFEQALHKKGRVACDGIDGLWSLASALAVKQSAQTGQVVSIHTDF